MQESKDLKISIAFSGGGFRAAAFCLGSLTFLERLKVEGKSLSDYICVLSTVSGGTITGARYAIGKRRGENFKTIYDSLYEFMNNTDIVKLALDRLIDDTSWDQKRVRSLINAFADVYDKELFQSAKFELILSNHSSDNLKHVSFNSTEFSHALQFRFQCSEKILRPRINEPEFGIIGNAYLQINRNVAKEIRMGDILASSSCFPGGFEPINFPDDFAYHGAHGLNELCKDSRFPVGLMDGGIVDNQGIEPILLAEERMKHNRMENNLSNENEIDLIILSDVASPYMENYKASVEQKINWWRSLTLRKITSINSILIIVFLLFMIVAVSDKNITGTVVSTFMLTVSLVAFFILRLLIAIRKRLPVPSSFIKPLSKLIKLKFQVYETFFINRINSMLKMTNDVFLKHIRRLNYRSIYNDKSWKNRRIMNAIYELRDGEIAMENKIKEGLPDFLIPSEKIKEVARKAASMGTTLWFTKEQIEREKMLDALIACGQFNICWNLLEYIQKLKTDSTNTNSKHKHFLTLEDLIKENWEKFQVNPFWLVQEFSSDVTHD